MPAQCKVTEEKQKIWIQLSLLGKGAQPEGLFVYSGWWGPLEVTKQTCTKNMFLFADTCVQNTAAL